MTLSSAVRAGLLAAGQDEAIKRLDNLPGDQQGALGRQLMELDLDLLVHTASLLQAPPKPLGKPKAPRIFALERGAEEQHRARLATQLGERLLSEGKLAFVLVAGGQASRLGYDAPKGAFPIGPVSQRSLFSMHAARLQAARKRYGKPIPWYP